jgi:DNA-binding winged helix-turn-helix (wHTH) protein
MSPAPTFAFGPYLFIPTRQLLLNDGQPVRLGGRALDLLTALVKRPGELLSKRQLMEEAWPSTTVVEGNLKVHIAALRRVLEDDPDAASYIATVNGRGYRFIAPVRASHALATPTAEGGAPSMMSEARAAYPPASRDALEGAVALLARTMRSAVIDFPSDGGENAQGPTTRRVLFIELTARDEAWIETIFTDRLSAISATR